MCMRRKPAGETASSDRRQANGSSDGFNLKAYLATPKYDGTHIMVGLMDPIKPTVASANLIVRRLVVVGSVLGGMTETQRLLDFCAKHDIACDMKMIDA